MVQHVIGKEQPPGRLVGVPPMPRHPVVGRDGAVADLRERLFRGEGVGITALQGLPGVGKTTLATALAHDDAVRGHFRGGVYWAGLGPQGDVESALNRWATALGAELGAARDAREKARRLAPVLEGAALGAPVLLVIDDVWRAEDAKPFGGDRVPRVRAGVHDAGCDPRAEVRGAVPVGGAGALRRGGGGAARGAVPRGEERGPRGAPGAGPGGGRVAAGVDADRRGAGRGRGATTVGAEGVV